MLNIHTLPNQQYTSIPSSRQVGRLALKHKTNSLSLRLQAKDPSINFHESLWRIHDNNTSTYSFRQSAVLQSSIRLELAAYVTGLRLPQYTVPGYGHQKQLQSIDISWGSMLPGPTVNFYLCPPFKIRFLHLCMSYQRGRLPILNYHNDFPLQVKCTSWLK